jgi:hypothetical protein
MFGLSKKKVETPVEQNISQPKEASGEVYIMPEKYMLLGNVKSGSKGLIIAGIILVFVIVITATFLIYDILESGRTKQQLQPQVTAPRVELVEQPVTTLPTTETEEELEGETDLDQTENETDDPEAGEELETGTENAVVPISLDSDGDGLTDLEEVIFGTSPTNPDTDGDGYRDATEILAGYNPTTAGSSKLEDSPFIMSLTANFNGYDYGLLYPKEWQSSLINANRQILITASTGEILRITIRENQSRLPALSWYLQENPTVAVSQLTMVDNLQRNLSGIYTPDKLMAYLTDSQREKIYIFEYVVGRQTEIRYPTIFSMLIRTFKVTEAEPNSGNTAGGGSENNLVTIIKNTAQTVLKNSCSAELTFCRLSPCGISADDVDSCLDNDEGYCYEKQCVTNSDCASGTTCQTLECFSGATATEVKLCQ